ncbi:MAG: hypothetical protein M1814_001227 [Vezdaea aestivalis]|nr:MAG: hypothetical protein M1814_001227 [Vezdaea aestivalis]
MHPIQDLPQLGRPGCTCVCTCGASSASTLDYLPSATSESIRKEPLFSGLSDEFNEPAKGRDKSLNESSQQPSSTDPFCAKYLTSMPERATCNTYPIDLRTDKLSSIPALLDLEKNKERVHTASYQKIKSDSEEPGSTLEQKPQLVPINSISTAPWVLAENNNFAKDTALVLNIMDRLVGENGASAGIEQSRWAVPEETADASAGKFDVNTPCIGQSR